MGEGGEGVGRRELEGKTESQSVAWNTGHMHTYTWYSSLHSNNYTTCTTNLRHISIYCTPTNTTICEMWGTRQTSSLCSDVCNREVV